MAADSRTNLEAATRASVAASQAWEHLVAADRAACAAMRAYLAFAKAGAWVGGDAPTLQGVADACRLAVAADKAHAVACAKARGESPRTEA